MEFEGALQLKIEKIIRSRVYETRYWKEECFGLNAETLIDKAVELDAIGGQYGNQVPTPFLCLVLKLLQIDPTPDIVLEYIRDPEFKYLRALGAFYLRVVGSPVDIYTELEPLLNDARKLRRRMPGGAGFDLTFMDEFVDQLLTEERVCDVILPRLPKRYILEDAGELEPRVSAIQDEFDAMVDAEDAARKDGGSDADMDVDEEVRDEDGSAPPQPHDDDDSRDDGEVPRSPRAAPVDPDVDLGKVKVSKKKVAKLFKDKSGASSSKPKSKAREEAPAGGDSDDGGAPSGGFRDSMSIEETNAMRIKLGLKPLRE
ncbi:hypothetical protein H9P43_001351 [Blastocladiella emersonii ATCC 22665]|nr:hypothetical protein H9P43_001351 [Blastocladiella emersonii ATCC 22665]